MKPRIIPFKTSLSVTTLYISSDKRSSPFIVTPMNLRSETLTNPSENVNSFQINMPTNYPSKGFISYAQYRSKYLARSSPKFQTIKYAIVAAFWDSNLYYYWIPQWVSNHVTKYCLNCCILLSFQIVFLIKNQGNTKYLCQVLYQYQFPLFGCTQYQLLQKIKVHNLIQIFLFNILFYWYLQ